MKIPRLSKIIGAAAIAAALAGPVKANAADIYFYGDINPGITWDLSSLAEVQTVPESIRNVPHHPDDSWISDSNMAPIKDGKASSSRRYFGLEGELGLGVRAGTLDFRIGPTAGYQWTMSTPSEVKERDYMGVPGSDQRGYGTALTYYGLTMKGIGKDHAFVPGISARISFLNKEYPENIRWFIEYSAKLNELDLETGWDRYNSLQLKDTYKLADILNHTLKLGGSFGFDTDNKENSFNVNIRPEFFIGMTIPQIIQKTSLADQTKLTLFPNFIAGFSLKIGFDTLQRKD